MIRVSIIVPIYNVEKYLDRSIQTLMKQTLQEIEIILVNDGSTDSSLEICKKYAQLDKRIYIIDKENGGVSSARNSGLEAANGEYIAFCDPDDYVELDMYESMYKKIIDTNADICISNYIVENNKGMKGIYNFINKEVLDEDEILNEVIMPMIAAETIDKKEFMGDFRSPWIYLYKLSVIQDNNLTFNINLPIGEDMVFNLSYLIKIKRLATLSRCTYHYCINSQSATKKYREDWWGIHKNLIKEIETITSYYKENQGIKQRMNVFKIIYIIEAISQEAHKDNPKTYRQINKKLKGIVNDSLIIKSIEEYDYAHLKIHKKIWFLLIKIKWVQPLYYYYKLRKVGIQKCAY